MKYILVSYMNYMKLTHVFLCFVAMNSQNERERERERLFKENSKIPYVVVIVFFLYVVILFINRASIQC